MSNTAKTEAHFVSELADRITDNNRAAAMKQYLQSEAHFNFAMAKTLTEYCSDSTEKLAKGEVAPTLDLFCDADTFTSVLTDKAYISYTECELPYEDGDDEDSDANDWREPERKDEELSDENYKHLSKLSDDDLAAALESDYGCDLSPYCIHVHKDDDKQQRDYHKAVEARFRAAAAFALSIGSDSARLWMDAVRLLQPKVLATEDADWDPDYNFGLGLVPANVAKAYARAEEAQAQLWVDVELRKMAKPRKRG